MVKPDVKHNYYADLELPTTASVDDIRKAYRKLALQYHPDRNAGKEAEVVPRFQAIQAANEVLCDPTTKAQYDADRRKASLYPSGSSRPSGPTGNPYQATSAYPPPPRRTQPGTWQRPTPTAGPSSNAGPKVPTGADRFSNFARPGNSAPPKTPAADRTEQFRAWQKMNNGPERNSARSPRPPPAPAPASGPPPKVPPRSRPGMPTEEKIRASYAYHGPPPATEAEEKATAWQHWKQQQQAAANNMGRSNTTRTPRKANGFDPNAPGSDERPAPSAGTRYSHRHRSEDMGSPMNAYPPPPPGRPPTGPNTPEPAGTPFVSPLRPPLRTQNSDGDDAPFSEANRHSTPYAAFSGEKTQPSSGLHRSKSTKDATKLPFANNSSGRAKSHSPVERNGPSASAKTSATRPTPSFVPYSSSDESPEEEYKSSGDARANGTTANGASKSTAFPNRPKKTPSRPSRRMNSTTTSTSQTDGAGFGSNPRSNEAPDMQQRQSGTNIFTVPFRSTNSSTESVSGRTEDNIDTTFSPGGWSGTFKGATDYFPNSTRKASPRRANSKSGFAPASAGSRKGSVPTSAHGPDGVTPTSSTLETPGGTKFSMEQWQKAFQDGSWVIPPPPSRPPKNLATDRGPGYDPNQAPSHTQGTKEDPHVVTDSSSDHTGDDVNRRARAAHPSADADAMDIDTPPPASTRPAESTSASDSAPEPRLYSVPPSVWRQQQSAHSRESQKTSPQPPSQKVTTDADLSASLHDLSNVEPIGNPGTTGDRGPGLQNLNELGTNLPFQSQASSVPPISITKQQQQQPSPFEPQRLHTPAVPSAPEPPTRLSQTSWHAHAAAFAKYLEAFHAFSKTLLTHFDAREQQAQARMHTGTIWLEAVGDGGTARSVGFGHYLQGVREDEAVRETWRVGCERHAEAVKEFDRLRGRVAQLISAGTFADS